MQRGIPKTENVQRKRFKSLTQAKKMTIQSRAPKDTQRHKTNNKEGAKYPIHNLHLKQNHHQVTICKHNMPSTFLNTRLSSLMFCSQIFGRVERLDHLFLFLLHSFLHMGVAFHCKILVLFFSEAQLWIDWVLLSFSDSFTNVFYVKAYLLNIVMLLGFTHLQVTRGVILGYALRLGKGMGWDVLKQQWWFSRLEHVLAMASCLDYSNLGLESSSLSFVFC